MATPVENKYCTRRNACITHTQLFTQLVLDAHVLDVAMNYRADVMAANPNRDNDGFRHAAYRQLFYGNMDALEPGTEALFHHVSFGQ